MNKDIQKIIKSSTFDVQDDLYVYAKVKKVTDFSKHFMVSRDKDEITLVTKEKNLEKKFLIEKNKDYYNLISLNVSLPFYAVGFLAAVSEAIAKHGMNILIISTYSKDYILVRQEHLDEAVKVLISLGFKEKSKK